MKRENLDKWLEELKKDLGIGYYIASINSKTCYFYYSYEDKVIDILFSTDKLSVNKLKNYIERRGQKISIKNPKQNMVLEKYIGYLDGSYEYQVNFDEGFYQIKEHQIPFIYNETKTLYKMGVINKKDDDKLNQSLSFKYNERKREQNKNRRKIKL